MKVFRLCEKNFQLITEWTLLSTKILRESMEESSTSYMVIFSNGDCVLVNEAYILNAGIRLVDVR